MKDKHDNQKYLDKIEAQFKKDYGDNIIVDAEHILNHPPQIVPLSPKLDLAIGGVPEGSWITSSGAPKSGKTTTALSFAANAQKDENGGRFVYYLNIEG